MIYKKCQKCFEKYEYGTTCSCISKHNKKMKSAKGKVDNFYSSDTWRKLRKSVIQDDGGYCQRCMSKWNIFITEDLEVHHIIARDIDRKLELERSNLVTVCKTCNLQLGTSGVDWEHDKNKPTHQYCL